jgi:hypothetical protein
MDKGRQEQPPRHGRDPGLDRPLRQSEAGRQRHPRTELSPERTPFHRAEAPGCAYRSPQQVTDASRWRRSVRETADAGSPRRPAAQRARRDKQVGARDQSGQPLPERHGRGESRITHRRGTAREPWHTLGTSGAQGMWRSTVRRGGRKRPAVLPQTAKRHGDCCPPDGSMRDASSQPRAELRAPKDGRRNTPRGFRMSAADRGC